MWGTRHSLPGLPLETESETVRIFEIHLLHAIGGDFGRLIHRDTVCAEFGVGCIHIRTAEEEANVTIGARVEVFFTRGALLVKFVCTIQHQVSRTQAEPALVEMIRTAAAKMWRVLNKAKAELVNVKMH